MNDLLWRREKARRGRITAAGALVLLAMGAAFAGWTVVRQDRRMREDLIYHTQMIGQSIHLDRLRQLEGNISDESKPAYRRLKEQLLAVQQINPAWRWIYLMGRTADGSIFIQIDSEPADSPDMSPPGQVYNEATQELQDVFRTGQTAVEGPVEDRWGTWISAFVPLKDPRTGRLIMVAGIDVDARQWDRMRFQAARPALFSSLALLAIWLGGNLLLARRARPSACRTPFDRHVESSLTVATGVVVTATAAWLSLLVETHSREMAFRHFANTETGFAFAAAQELRNLELAGFAAFIANSEEVTYEEFQEYGKHLLRLPEVVYWTWSEIVPATHRESFEKAAAIRSRKPEYRIWEKDEKGHSMRAGERDRYYPIIRQIPTGNEDYQLGFDLGSDPVRLAALEKARRTGFATASDPLQFRQASRTDKGILVTLPVYDPGPPEHLKGFISAGLKIRSWLRASRDANPDRHPMAVLDLFQLQRGQPARWMGTTRKSLQEEALPFGGGPGLSIVRPLLMFGKAYAILARPTPEFLHLYPAIIAWLVALAGVVITGSMAWVLGFFANRRENVARMLDEQHHELATSLRRYDQLARQSRTFTWETDANGLYTELSGVALDVLGYAPEELIGQKYFYDLHPAEDREEFMAMAFDAFARRQPFLDLANPVVAKSGAIVWVATSGMPILDAAGNLLGYQGTDKDITERKRAEDDLRESRRQYASLLANLPGMAYRCANDRNWTMDFVSAGCQDLTGYAPEDLIGNKTVSFNDLICPPHRDRLWEKWQRILPAHGKFEDEYEITTRTGETKWVWEQGEGVYGKDGQVMALEGFIADITERKRAGTERERLTRAIEQSLEIILITDEAGSIVYVNPAFTRATGYSREEALGKNPRLLQSGQHSREFYQGMWQTLLAGHNWEGQIINRRKDGSLYTEMATISPVRDADGRIVNYVAVKRDITQELQAQQEKENLQGQLVQAQKMESIGRLAGGVAHDFNNMLQAILGYTEMALEEVKPGEPLHADLKEIQKASQRSAALTRQLQAFARKQIALPRVLDLNEAVEGMSSMLRRLIGERIELAWKPGRPTGLVKIDPGQLDQILANLCINARDAIEKSGHITLETRDIEIRPPAHPLPGDLPPGSYVVLTIRDDGAGMTPDVIEHLFEPFFTTKQPGKGTGLGLATAYGIVKQNNGEILVQSEPGQGSTFQIYLPRQTGEADPAPINENECPVGRGSETVLLVEDEKSILQATGRILESLGYQVLSTSLPDEAIHLAEEHKSRIKLLLTDVIMPEMNGPELVQRLQQRHPRLNYLYMSGYTANLIAEQGVREDSVNFIPKPFTRRALAQKVREAIDGA